MSVMLLIAIPKISWGADADRQTLFNNLTDNIATVGKEDWQKRRIVYERKEARRQERLTKERIRRENATKRQMKQQQKIIMKKINAINQAKHNK